MPSDVPQSTASEPRPSLKSRASPWFTVPEPIRRVFNQFPLISYSSNELPARSPNERHVATLHVFTTTQSARVDRPSYNPACLKWQAYLKFREIDFRTVPSNNHASPTGALPFLLPSIASNLQPVPAVTSHKIPKWADSQSTIQDEVSGMRYDAYSSLVDHRIRSAWLYALYLDDMNFATVAKRLYINSASSNSLVRATLTYQLQQAARDELVKYSSCIDEEGLYAEAEKAFEALSALLSHDENFFGQEQPGLFDASVFAYTHLLLDSNLGWQNNKLSDALRRNANLVQHRQRILDHYFSR